MVRVQPERFREILVDEVMEAQYHQFGSSESGSVRGEPQTAALTVFAGMRRIVVCVLYGVLVLLLLILMMITGIKLSLLTQEITDVKLHLEKISHGKPMSGATAVVEVLLPNIVPVRGQCKEGWVSFQRNCYLLSTATMTWRKAEELCQSHGGHLVVFNSVEELDYISKVAEIQYNYWIGLVERQHEGHWSWVDGTDFSSTTAFWDEGQPDDWAYRENGEDCGQLHSSDKRKRKMWNDADCNLLYQYICESRA